MTPLKPELQKELDDKREALQKSLDNGTFKVDTLELSRLLNTSSSLAKKMDENLYFKQIAQLFKRKS